MAQNYCQLDKAQILFVWWSFFLFLYPASWGLYGVFWGFVPRQPFLLNMKTWHSGQVGILVQNRTELTYTTLILTTENVGTKSKHSLLKSWPIQTKISLFIQQCDVCAHQPQVSRTGSLSVFINKCNTNTYLYVYICISILIHTFLVVFFKVNFFFL